MGEIGFQFLTAVVGLKGVPIPVTGAGMGVWLINRHEKKYNGRLREKKFHFFPRQGYRTLFHFGQLCLNVTPENLWSSRPRPSCEDNTQVSLDNKTKSPH